jgi:hypothetical protein
MAIKVSGVTVIDNSRNLVNANNITSAGTIAVNSDERIKTNIVEIENALEKVLSLRGVEYDRVDNGEHHIGLIAQEVEKIIPEVVSGKNLPDYELRSVAYQNLVALLIEAIKEQNVKIENLQAEIERLK